MNFYQVTIKIYFPNEIINLKILNYYLLTSYSFLFNLSMKIFNKIKLIVLKINQIQDLYNSPNALII